MQFLNRKTMPSAKLVRWVRLFHFSLGLFLLLGTLLLNGCSSNSVAAVPPNWRQTDVISPALLQLAISENTSTTPDRLNQILVASIPIQDEQQLHLFNYNSPNTCGQLGCLYVAYLEQGQSSYRKVLSLYLKPNLPSTEVLISLSSETANSALPCLEVKQINQENLQNLIYCFDGRSYQLTKSSRIKLPRLG